MENACSIRDVMVSNGVVKFVEVTFDDNGDAGCSWTATLWRSVQSICSSVLRLTLPTS